MDELYVAIESLLRTIETADLDGVPPEIMAEVQSAVGPLQRVSEFLELDAADEFDYLDQVDLYEEEEEL